MSVVREILSITEIGHTYDTAILKSIRASIGYFPLPKSVLGVYMDLMAECGLFMKVESNYVKL